MSALGGPHETFHTREAIGRIGGGTAWAALGSGGKSDHDIEHRLMALASNRDPAAVPFIHKLVNSWPSGPLRRVRAYEGPNLVTGAH